MSARFTLPRPQLGTLITTLRSRGYEVIGPTVHDGAIVYDVLQDDSALPTGLTDVQRPGYYRLEHRSDPAVFGFGAARVPFTRVSLAPTRRKVARLGTRGCELAGLEVQDCVDAPYAADRGELPERLSLHPDPGGST